MRARARRMALLALLPACAWPGTAGATTGNVYPAPPGTYLGVAEFAHASQAGSAWTIAIEAQQRAWLGAQWQMRFRCDREGTELALVRFGGLRTAPASHLEVRVDQPFAIWGEPDALMPRTPDPGRLYDVGIAPGQCEATLKLVQTSNVAQHARTYFIDSPIAFMRDVSAPRLGVRESPPGWVNASYLSARFRWSTSDNFGSDGIAGQRITVDGVEAWSGTPGEGEHLVDLPTSGAAFRDGVRVVRFEVDGDGTPGVAEQHLLYIDRLAPYLNALETYFPGQVGKAGFSWFAWDPTSGLAARNVQVNTATDGTSNGAWVNVWTESAGLSRVEVPVDAIPDGVHKWRLIADDHAANRSIADAPHPVVVDRVAPVVTLQPIARDWVASLPLTLTQRDNLEAQIGLGATEVYVNTATDGSKSGDWVQVSVASDGPGTHSRSVALRGLADGVHSVWVVARNGPPFSAVLAGQAFDQVHVDLTGPVVSATSFEPDPAGMLRVSWLAEDRLSGVATAVVQVQSGADWKTLGSTPATNGVGALKIDSSKIPEGGRRFRLMVLDRAGNVSIQTGSAGVDRKPPTLRDLGVRGGPPWSLAWTQADPDGAFGACATAIRIKGPGTGLEWRELVSGRFGEGPQTVVLPLDGIAAGAYQVQVIACDAAGNTAAAETGGLLIPAGPGAGRVIVLGPGSPSPGAGSPAVRSTRALRGARLRAAVVGARRAQPVRRLTFGRALLIAGRLVNRRGRGIARAVIEVRDRRGRTAGRVLTDGRGRFRLRAVPRRSGPLRVGVAVGRRLALAGRPVVRVRLRPRIRLVASSHRALAFGRPIVLEGRVAPAPTAFAARRKRIVLEWRDPVRRAWRPVLNARTRADGRFRVAWRFGVRGYTIPMRIRVPAERGWALHPAVSRAVAIRVV